jgi:hypothetical protein
MENIIDYTEQINNCIMAQGKNNNVLILRKLDCPIKRFDGNRSAKYELEHRWLSVDCQHEKDEAHVCIQGNDFTYWTKKEINCVLSGKSGMFEYFKLY